jgi:hypothetical protein
MQGGVKRALVYVQNILRDLLNPLGDRPTMFWLGLQRTEDQEVEGAL